jgi:thiamine transport system permease protein
VTASFHLKRYWLAPVVVLVALFLGVMPLVGFAVARGGALLPDGYAWRIAGFTVFQAVLSTLLSVGFAIPVARAMARQQFRGRSLLLAVFAVPLSLPVIVAIFGLTALYGAAGLFSGLVDVYGLQGILLAHIFFNLPLATRLLLEALETTAPENHRLAAQLGLNASAIWRHVDWPTLKPVLPAVASLVFLLCAGSFVIVLIFGGPGFTTLEVAIYQSLRMDFDVSRALTLAFLQLALSMALVLLMRGRMGMPPAQPRNRVSIIRYDGKSVTARAADCVAIGGAVLLVVPPLISVVVSGAPHINLTTALATAMITSFAIAAVSTVLALALGWGMAVAQARLSVALSPLLALGLGGYLVPPAVLATGWFLAVRAIDGGWPLSVALIAAMNCLMALPFLLTVLHPAVVRNMAQHDRLCAQLGISGWRRFRLIEVPSSRGAFGQAALMAFVLSLGDLTAVTLLGSNGVVTLPALVQLQMGHFQSEEAGGTALLLAALCLGLALAAQRASRWT